MVADHQGGEYQAGIVDHVGGVPGSGVGRANEKTIYINHLRRHGRPARRQKAAA